MTQKEWNKKMYAWAKRVTRDIRNIEEYLESIDHPGSNFKKGRPPRKSP